MKRSNSVLCCVIAVAVLFLAACGGRSAPNSSQQAGSGGGSLGGSSGGSGSLKNVNHIILFLQENRSLDHYFGALRAYWAQNGIPDQSFDGLPQFNPASGAAPLQGPAPSLPGCDPASPAPNDCVFDPNNPVTSYHLIT